MKKILFDTDVLIEHLRGNDAVTQAILTLIKGKSLLAYTSVTEAELFHGVRNKKETALIDQLLGVLYCLDINKEVGKWAGHYLNQFHKSHGMNVADATIAATAHVNRYTLWTLNLRHYPMTDIEKYSI